DTLVSTDRSPNTGIARYQRQSLAALINGETVNEIAPPAKNVTKFVFGETGANPPSPQHASTYVDLTFNGSDGPLQAVVGDRITVAWTSQNVTGCTLSQAGAVPLAPTSVAVSSSQLGAPLTSAYIGTTTTTIVCTKSSGGTVSDSAVLVVKVAPPPITGPWVSILADGQESLVIPVGGSYMVAWDSKNVNTSSNACIMSYIRTDGAPNGS